MKLLLNALSKYLIGLLLVGVLLFLPAGTLAWSGAWLFCALLFLPMFLLGVVLFLRAPQLLQKRLDAKEKEADQRGITALAALMFPVGFIIAGLDFRFGWSHIPQWAVIAASAVLLISYALYGEVMRENAYLSRTITVQNGQTVVDTGLYGMIRHPMYAVTVWMFLSIPVILGSLWALLCFVPYIGIIVLRIRGEEALLETELAGYSDYKKRVKYRLIPLVW